MNRQVSTWTPGPPPPVESLFWTLLRWMLLLALGGLTFGLMMAAGFVALVMFAL